MNLEELVPPLELCKQIPEGCFETSVFVWWTDCYGTMLIKRIDTPYEYGIDAPAPTLEEIMADLTEFQPAIVAFWRTRAEVQCWGDQIEEVENAKSTTAALKLWLKMKGSK